jgi:hypothetical protein
MKPVPRGVFDDAEYPDSLEHPLFRLKARCLGGWHKVVVGEAFRWSDELVRLSATEETWAEQWEEWTGVTSKSHGFPVRRRAWCPTCRREQWMVPLGVGEADDE